MSTFAERSRDGAAYSVFWITTHPAEADRPRRISAVYDDRAYVDNPIGPSLLLTESARDATTNAHVKKSAHDAAVRAAADVINYINLLIIVADVYPPVDLEIIIPRRMALVPIIRYLYAHVGNYMKASDLSFVYEGRMIEDTDSAYTLGLGILFITVYNTSQNTDGGNTFNM